MNEAKTLARSDSRYKLVIAIHFAARRTHPGRDPVRRNTFKTVTERMD
jgi:hypothetical protein